jgi:uncharacterized membrane protein YccC
MNITQFINQAAAGLANALGWRIAQTAPKWAVNLVAIAVIGTLLYNTL